MIHRIAHWLNLNGCQLEAAPDALYLVCAGCAERKFFAEYSFKLAAPEPEGGLK